MIAMEATSKVGAAIIIETWPLLAMFLAPLLITKDWNKIKFSDYVSGLIALIGVGFIMLGDQKNMTQLFTDFQGYSQSDDFKSIIGIGAALVGSLCIALSIILSTEVSNKISAVVLQEKSHSMNCTFMAETIRRIVALPPTCLLIFAFHEDLYATWEGIALTSITGIFIFNIGNVAISLALLKAKSPNINMIYYLTPILGVFWLYMIGKGDLTPMIFIGGALIILSNLIVIALNQKDKSKQASS
jgi:drug/metabolite transporter (DMT)-like permease